MDDDSNGSSLDAAVREEQDFVDYVGRVLEKAEPSNPSQLTPYRHERDGMRAYEQSREKADPEDPYFARLVFDDGLDIRIGKCVVFDGSDALVASWRAPVATAFYQPVLQAGLDLRRRVTIESSQVRSVSDERRSSAPAAEDSRPITTIEPALPDDVEDPHVSEEPRLLPSVTDELLASMLKERSGQLQEVIATIQADQYEAIASSSDAPLIIEGGPGTGKTVVLLHRLAYLLYEDDRSARRISAGPCLVLGPTDEFVRYVSGVLPSLGEANVQHRTVDQLFTDRLRIEATVQDSPSDSRVKGDARILQVIDRFLDKPLPPIEDQPMPRRAGRGLPALNFTLPATVIARARDRAEARPVSYFNRREAFRSSMVSAMRELLVEKFKSEIRLSAEINRRVESEVKIAQNSGLLNRLVEKFWPAKESRSSFIALFGDPQEILECGRGILSDDELTSLVEGCVKYAGEGAFSSADLALIDYFETRLEGNPPGTGHVVVDEAQDVSAVQLRCIVARSGPSITVAGDPRQGLYRRFGRSLRELAHDLPPDTRYMRLKVGYRVPAEIMKVADAVGLAFMPHAPGPIAVRATEQIPEFLIGGPDQVALAVEYLLGQEAGGSIGIVAGAESAEVLLAELARIGIPVARPGSVAVNERVVLVSPNGSRGLEFDHVVVVNPLEFVRSADDLGSLYVALTRATKSLTVVTEVRLPDHGIAWPDDWKDFAARLPVVVPARVAEAESHSWDPARVITSLIEAAAQARPLEDLRGDLESGLEQATQSAARASSALQDGRVPAFDDVAAVLSLWWVARSLDGRAGGAPLLASSQASARVDELVAAASAVASERLTWVRLALAHVVEDEPAEPRGLDSVRQAAERALAGEDLEGPIDRAALGAIVSFSDTVSAGGIVEVSEAFSALHKSLPVLSDLLIAIMLKKVVIPGPDEPTLRELSS